MNRRYDLFQLYRKSAQLIQNKDPTREIALELIAMGEAMLALIDEAERADRVTGNGQGREEGHGPTDELVPERESD